MEVGDGLRNVVNNSNTVEESEASPVLEGHTVLCDVKLDIAAHNCMSERFILSKFTNGA